MEDAFELSVVIPAYNEALRLPRTLLGLAQYQKTAEAKGVKINEIIIVDDGSADDTLGRANSFKDLLPQIKGLKSDRNYGKGHAVRQGLMNSTAQWVLVADADMSTPWQEIDVLHDCFKSEQSDILIGSRGLKESRIQVRQSSVREHMGKAFNLIIRCLTNMKFRDTQCGFKLIRRSSVEPLFSCLKVDGFAWDVELLLLARKKGLAVSEVPIRWKHVDESRVHPLFDAAEMLWSFAVIRLRSFFW